MRPGEQNDVITRILRTNRKAVDSVLWWAATRWAAFLQRHQTRRRRVRINARLNNGHWSPPLTSPRTGRQGERALITTGRQSEPGLANGSPEWSAPAQTLRCSPSLILPPPPDSLALSNSSNSELSPAGMSWTEPRLDQRKFGRHRSSSNAIWSDNNVLALELFGIRS